MMENNATQQPPGWLRLKITGMVFLLVIDAAVNNLMGGENDSSSQQSPSHFTILLLGLQLACQIGEIAIIFSIPCSTVPFHKGMICSVFPSRVLGAPAFHLIYFVSLCLGSYRMVSDKGVSNTNTEGSL
jgi:hypothetical protein